MSVRQRLLNRARSDRRPFNELLQYYAMERFLYRLSQSVHADRFTEDADYEGVRIRFPGALGSARIHMQIDIGFGDVVYPEPVESELPTMLDSPAPRLLCYSRESTIAEKLEAMVKRGVLNSRMKAFYHLSSQPSSPANQIQQSGPRPVHGSEPVDFHLSKTAPRFHQ